MKSISSRVKIALVIGVAFLTAVGIHLTVTNFGAADTPTTAVRIQILALNDFHGNLEPLSGPAGAVTILDQNAQQTRIQAGGVARIATLLREARNGHTATITVGVGDMIGASPFPSAVYHDEPTIRVLEKLGLEVNAIGNHEFDEGKGELQRIVNGGCHPTDGCIPGETYHGAAFPQLAANVIEEGRGKPILPPYWVKDFGGVKVGFIGVVTKDTPARVVPSGIGGLSFADEAQTINQYADELSNQGVHAIVALVHEGGMPASEVYDYDCDASGPGSGLSGAIKTIAENTSPKVDLILSGHTHEPYICNIPDPQGQRRLVTQAAAFGRMLTDIQFEVDPATGHVRRETVQAKNKIVTLDIPEDPHVRAFVDTWKSRSTAKADEPVGYISGDFLGRGATTMETALGDLVADSQVEATRDQGAQLAFVLTGGLRSDLMYSTGNPPGLVTFGNLFEALPFGNTLVTMDLTGAQLVELLRQQYVRPNADKDRLLQPSDALRYSIDPSRPGAEKILVDTIRIDGQPLDLSRTYRVTANNFLAEGGNSFTVFKEGTNRVESPVNDINAIVDYFKKHTSVEQPLAPLPANRVTFH